MTQLALAVQPPQITPSSQESDGYRFIAHPRSVHLALTATDARCSCRVEVRLTVDGAVSAATGTPEVGLGDHAREGWCRIITAVLIARRSYAARNSWIRLLMLDGAGPSGSSRRLDEPGLRSGPAVIWHPGSPCSWVMPRRPSGHLNRRMAAQRVWAAAVTRMYQHGRPDPLPGRRVNGVS